VSGLEALAEKARIVGIDDKNGINACNLDESRIRVMAVKDTELVNRRSIIEDARRTLEDEMTKTIEYPDGT
jgi:hypothetical protein